MVFALISLLLIFSGPSPMREEYKKAVDKNISAILGYGELKFLHTDSGKEYYSFRSSEERNNASMVLSSAKGRFESFDYMIIINPDYEIIDIKILKYRSEYGYEISNKGWLKQFYSKPDTRFEYRKNIDALSGATFSAQSLVNDVNLIIDYLKK
ncbi:MAG: FMN-binding protein [Bacteroidales bacterium]|nr:FMN-binding protein [Bacteroidales bacterium]